MAAIVNVTFKKVCEIVRLAGGMPWPCGGHPRTEGHVCTFSSDECRYALAYMCPKPDIAAVTFKWRDASGQDSVYSCTGSLDAGLNIFVFCKYDFHHLGLETSCSLPTTSCTYG